MRLMSSPTPHSRGFQTGLPSTGTSTSLDNDLASEPHHGASSIDPVILINSFSALLGISMFAVPWGFLMSGIIGGIMVIITIAYLSFETTRILLLAQSRIFLHTGEIPSYADIAAEYLGPPFGLIVKLSTVISCLGGCIGSLIFIASLLSQLLHVHFKQALLYLGIPLVLLSWIRSFRELTFFTLFGSIAILFSIFILLIDGYLQYSSESMTVHELNGISLFLPRSIEFIGPVTFLFTIHYIVLSMGKEVLSQNHFNFPKFSDENLESLAENHTRLFKSNKLIVPLAVSYATCSFILSFLGTLGYLWYRNVNYVTDHSGDVIPGCEEHICENIILNLSKGPLRYYNFHSFLPIPVDCF